MNEHEANDPIPLSDIDSPAQPSPHPTADAGHANKSPKIRAFSQKLFEGRHEDNWNRTPNSPGTGAIHVRSFHCKFNEDSLAHLDQQINEWLDSHPQYEVKFVTTCHGEWKSKFGIEPCLIVQVWV